MMPGQTSARRCRARIRQQDADLSAAIMEETHMLSRLFLEHPRSVDETYFQHLGFALWFSSRLLAAGVAAFIHALLPFCFEKTAGNIIAELHTRMTGRR
jgi:hypothetical protein